MKYSKSLLLALFLLVETSLIIFLTNKEAPILFDPITPTEAPDAQPLVYIFAFICPSLLTKKLLFGSVSSPSIGLTL